MKNKWFTEVEMNAWMFCYTLFKHACPGLSVVDGQGHLILLLGSGLDSLLVSYTQNYQFLIAMHEMGHTALCNDDPMLLAKA